METSSVLTPNLHILHPAEKYCPSSKAVACKLQKYSKSPQGTIDMYYKYVGTYYADTSCSSTSYAGTSTYYRHNYFS